MSIYYIFVQIHIEQTKKLTVNRTEKKERKKKRKDTEKKNEANKHQLCVYVCAHMCNSQYDLFSGLNWSCDNLNLINVY